MWNAKRSIAGSGLAVLAVALLLPVSSRAVVANQATQITFNQPVRIPGQLLPAGTYWFTIADLANPNVMRVWNADGTRLLSQLTTADVDHAPYGSEATADGVNWPTGKLVMTFAEGRKPEPAALLDWFYPGDTQGHQLVYSSSRQKQLDREHHETMAVHAGDMVTVGRSPATGE